MQKARHDYIELSFIYVTAIVTLLALSTIASPVNTGHFGLITPTQEKKESTSTIYDIKAFDDIKVIAKSYVIYDIVDKRVISSKNEDQILTLASLTKVMTAVTALTHNKPDTKITIDPKVIDGKYDLGLKKNQVWKLEELLKYTLVFSSNDGAIEIANGLGGQKAFVEQMNNDAVLLGLKLHFNHPAGLDVGNLFGGEGTALEVAKLFAIARKRFPEILDATTHDRVTVTASTGKITGVPNTNQEIEDLLGAEASKTGFTDNAGGNLAVVVDTTVGHPVVIVVLGSTREGRFSDISKLFKALQKSIGKSVEK